MCPTKPARLPATAAPAAAPATANTGTVRLTFTRNTVDGRGVVLHSHAIEEAPSVTEDFTLSLDTQANLSVFNNMELLENIREAPAKMSIQGIDSSGPPLIATLIGDFRPLGVTAYYHPRSAANVLCFYDVATTAMVEYNQQENVYRCIHPDYGHEFIFNPEIDPSNPEHKMYRNHDLAIQPPLTGMALTTVAELEHGYSKRQLELAKVARKLGKDMGYPSVRQCCVDHRAILAGHE